MLSLIKHSLGADGTNPICKNFKLGRHVASAGPEMVWRIYEATRLSDGYVSTWATYSPTRIIETALVPSNLHRLSNDARYF